MHGYNCWPTGDLSAGGAGQGKTTCNAPTQTIDVPYPCLHPFCTQRWCHLSRLPLCTGMAIYIPTANAY